MTQENFHLSDLYRILVGFDKELANKNARWGKGKYRRACLRHRNKLAKSISKIEAELTKTTKWLEELGYE